MPDTNPLTKQHIEFFKKHPLPDDTQDFTEKMFDMVAEHYGFNGVEKAYFETIINIARERQCLK